ncbi:unnamed protein product [Calicophoron daubneyi]|uniref:Dynactin subunit 2 n=1 Tax=Calicophoron daubneyi TaxID=300641 RepID=A0AAV2TNF1_CALDB
MAGAPLDPKYAGLPWIAQGQPDVYEAGELPEVDQKSYNDEIDDVMMTKEIQAIKLSVDEAHKRFAGCKVDSTNVDFSDSIAGRGKVGYYIDSDEYDIYPPGARENETLVSRLQRLQAEVTQLADDASAVKEQTDIESTKQISPADLTRAVESLRGQLTQLSFLSSGDAYSVSTTEDAEKALCSKILSELDSFKPEANEKRKPEESSHLVYEIYGRVETSKPAELERIADFDRRIQRLEALVGQPDPNKISALTADTAQHSLSEAATRLAARSALLQPGHLDMIEARLNNLQTKLQTITEKREAIADADTQNKVAELYELVKKWNDVADSLPMIVERLTELKDLHEEASEFNSVLSTVENSQKLVDENLKVYSKLLNEVQNNIGENVKVIMENMTSLEKRLS